MITIIANLNVVIFLKSIVWCYTINLILQFQLFQHNYTGRGVKVVIFSWAWSIFKIILKVGFSNIKLALYLWWKASRYRQWKTHPWYFTHVILWYLQYPSNLKKCLFYDNCNVYIALCGLNSSRCLTNPMAQKYLVTDF